MKTIRATLKATTAAALAALAASPAHAQFTSQPSPVPSPSAPLERSGTGKFSPTYFMLDSTGVLTLTSAATAGATVPVQNTYTAAGGISPTDDVSFVNSASTIAVSVANGTVDLHIVRIYQTGAGTVNVTANIAGTSQTIPLATSGTLKSTLLLRWSVAFGTYFIE